MSVPVKRTLFAAAEVGDLERLLLILDRRANVDERDLDGRTCLVWAVVPKS
jgi:ankyrin repeat protein